MKDYTPYRDTFLVHKWTHIPVRDEWLHPNHVFGLRNPLSQEMKEWLDKNLKGSYAFLEDEDNYVNHVIAFSREYDATFFLLRWI
jgi:hypothetical protein